MEDDKDKIQKIYIKKITDALNDEIGNNYIFNKDAQEDIQGKYLREYVDAYALAYYKSTGENI